LLNLDAFALVRQQRQVSRFARNDSATKGKEKTFFGGFAAEKRPPLSHLARHSERSEESLETTTGS